MKQNLLYLFLLANIACTSNHYPSAPANPDASPEAVQLLNFLYSIQGKYILSGQHNFLYEPVKYTELVHQITGRYPVVWGCDFSFNVSGEDARKFQHCGPANLMDYADTFRFHGIHPDTLRERMVQKAIELWKKGHIITLMWHHCFPPLGDTCNGSSVWAMENRPSPELWDSLVTEGTALNNAWKKQAEIIVPWLQKLRDAHVPVLWRPYHEMNGVWFWWCNQQGENGFPRLWKMMFRYFTREKKLNNLLWVWNANAPRDIPGDEAYPYYLFYPGNEYVDVLAADVYRNDYRQEHHDQLVLLGKGKPIAIGETGDVPVDSILSVQPRWTWFMVWGYFIRFSQNPPEKVKALYNSSRVLTLDELIVKKDGLHVAKPEKEF